MTLSDRYQRHIHEDTHITSGDRMSEESETGPVDKMAAFIKDGDMGGFILATLDSREAAAEGRFCECAEPLVEHGRGKSTMCHHCLLRNQKRYDEVTAFLKEPHSFEPHERVEFMCDFCSYFEDDPRHQIEAARV